MAIRYITQKMEVPNNLWRSNNLAQFHATNGARIGGPEASFLADRPVQ